MWKTLSRTRRITIALLTISLAMTVWFILGSFVTYSPAVSAADLQNIYLSRIVRFGSAIGALQAAALAATLLNSNRQ